MSANNQILIKKHGDKYYVFDNVMAESWDKKNILHQTEAAGAYKTKLSALNRAEHLQREAVDEGYPVEYGVQFDTLAKDGADVLII
jgi:hypothetical protein